MNYLILTPDGMGSTMLQRMLTVYLNVFTDYYNTHELTNGVENLNGTLVRKQIDFGYGSSIDEIVNMINHADNNLVSRVANYHLNNRLNYKDTLADHDKFYKCLNASYEKTVACYRDPFEYALSWSIRNITQKLNVYSLEEKNSTFLNKTFDINIEFFNTKLKEFTDYDYWVNDNFDNIIWIDYDQIVGQIQHTLATLTQIDQDIFLKKFEMSLDCFNTMYYFASEYRRTGAKKISSQQTRKFFEILKFVDDLKFERKLPSGIPIKMNTLETKQNIVNNFDQAIKNYNLWAGKHNKFEEIDHKTLQNRMEIENKKFSHVSST